jgi:hypothetical protein
VSVSCRAESCGVWSSWLGGMALCGDIRRNDNRPVANCGFAFCWLSTNTAWKDRVYRSTPSCRARTIRQAASSFSSLTCNGCFLSGLRSTGPSPNPFSGRFRFVKKSLATSDFYRSALVTMDSSCRYLNLIETCPLVENEFCLRGSTPGSLHVHA